eukprot:TRINITY_DN88961_c0_g1_i1.p1 TRINITY_DN88961_c0_g1~~TRINITY_DN88961_c0_g1_i1.p1  ORF type:complete len:493 (+),score=136.56 TRINITY_DN88961_c0_g1_i1:51-1481(+)
MAAVSRSCSSILQKHGLEVVKKIGEGSFGQALLVQDSAHSKLVCKMIDVSQASAKEVQDTRKEAQLLAAFKHPFIVEYRANFLDAGWLCILMAFCEGGDLTTQVEIARGEKRRIAESQVLRWMTQALLALKHIHDKHVLHRDLKSSNFFLSKAGNLKMGDFGIAKVLSHTQAVARTQIGTPYYLSPEVCQEKPYGWPSDIWAMGVILHELCALKLPFDGGSNMVILVQSIVRGTAPPLPEEYSDFVKRLCFDMLQKNPAHRPSAGAILNSPPMQSIVQQFFEEAKQKAAKDSAAAEPVAPDMQAYRSGDLVEYYSNTHNSWVPAVVTGVDGEGRVVLDVKPNTWMSREQQSQQLRPRTQVPDEVPPAAEAPSKGCSTMVFEQMLQQVEPASPPTAPQAHFVEEPGQELAAAAAAKIGIEAARSLEDEYSSLLEELECGLDSEQQGSPATGDGYKAVIDDLAGSLTQAELDMLNDGM